MNGKKKGKILSSIKSSGTWGLIALFSLGVSIFAYLVDGLVMMPLIFLAFIFLIFSLILTGEAIDEVEDLEEVRGEDSEQ